MSTSTITSWKFSTFSRNPERSCRGMAMEICRMYCGVRRISFPPAIRLAKKKFRAQFLIIWTPTSKAASSLAPKNVYLTERMGAVGVGVVGPIVPVHPDHQQGVAEIKFCIACHLGGALLKGLIVSRNDSRAPHSPYWLGPLMSE